MGLAELCPELPATTPDVQKLAKVLGLSKSYVYELCQAGVIGFYIAEDGHRRIPDAELDRLGMFALSVQE